MKKSECETAIRHLCHVWAKETGCDTASGAHPNVAAFISWVRGRHPAYLEFRSAVSPEYDIEPWFDQELKQTWRR